MTFFAHLSFFSVTFAHRSCFLQLAVTQLALKIDNDLLNVFHFDHIFLASFPGDPRFLVVLNFRLGPQNLGSPCRGIISTCHNPAVLIERAFEWLSLAICISNYNSVNNEFLHFGDSSKSGGPAPRRRWHIP